MVQKYDICVIGLGPVGTISGACFAKMGFQVIGVDKDPKKLMALSRGNSPFVEPGIDELIHDVTSSSHFSVTDNLREALIHCSVVMIAVGTPTPKNKPDLSQLDMVCRQIGSIIKQKNTPTVIAVRSTVPPGTIRSRLIPLIESVSGKTAGTDFHMASNPEFLREGSAIKDFFHTSRVIIGADSDFAAESIERLYKDVVADERLRVSIESAEFAKYVDNTWHALKVSFANEIGRVCQAAGGKIEETTHIFLSDRHLNISSCYLKPGFAFGGSCLPKDVRGLAYLARTLGVGVPVINAIMPSNDIHITLGMEAILEHNPKHVGLYGVAFKEKIDDLRESPALSIAAQLLEYGVNVVAHDYAYAPGEKIQLPRSEQLLEMVSLETLASNTDTVVIMHHIPEYYDLADQLQGQGKHIVDLTSLPKPATLLGEKDLQSSDFNRLVAG